MKRTRLMRAIVGALVVVTCLVTESTWAQAPSLRVSDNKRFLVDDQGQPFFYLGDTAWELFHRLDREQAVRYLKDRAAKGFTVVQAVALAELDGLNSPNAYGHRPLVDLDPTKLLIHEGEQNDYWDHVDFIITQANSLGLTIGLLPTWGDKWNKKWGVGPEIFTPDNSEQYGRLLGQRYKDFGVIWIVGGDRPVENDTHRQIIERMAKGLRDGDQGKHLITFHPSGGQGSSQYFHDAEWLDFNMRQNGHVAEFNPRYETTLQDYQRSPIKPIIDGEPIYEDHPISFNAKDFGHSVAADVRRPLYWNLFSGAFGHTYGHHSVWQMWQPMADRSPVNDPLMPWHEAIDQPGASQMQYAKQLLLSRPFLSRIPGDSLIITDPISTSVPGAGRYRFVATRDSQGRYAMVYVPVGRKFQVDMNKIKGPTVKAWWFNPRDGEATAAGEFPAEGTREFRSPDPHQDNDWVLVLDQVSQGFAPPGSTKARN